ncbi:MAG: enoyl-CoA hydratase/isomerase family protein [Rhodospirillales bacterium]|nr:enoyl-CoA hydratase/isomerase family protein [Rhodospirillales bacterium]
MIKERKYNEILFELKDDVAWITINRPQVLNAFREQTLDELIEAVKSIREDASIVAAVITGSGDRAFSAGGDFQAMMKLNRANAMHWNDRMLGLAMAIRGATVPVIAMVHGHCMGGGHELALWCDLVISADDGVFGQTGAKVGACPTVGATQYIPRLIGDRLAKEMIFLCRTFPAEEAVKIGLINKVVPKADLRRETEEWCQQMKGYSGQTLRATKKSLNFESDELYASWQQGMELLAEIWGSDESLEGMNAFLEKRKPDFHKFRLDRKIKVDQYLNDLDNDLNQDQSKF